MWTPAFSIVQLKDAVIGLVKIFWVFPRFLLLAGQGVVSRAVAWALAALFAGTLVWLTIMGLRHWPEQARRQGVFLAGMALLILVYGGFALWWNPGDVEFLLPLLVPIWAFFAVFLLQPAWPQSQANRGRGTIATTILLLVIIANNFAGRIGPNSRIANNRLYDNAGQLVRHIQPSDLLVLDTFSWDPYVRYFFNTTRRACTG